MYYAFLSSLPRSLIDPIEFIPRPGGLGLGAVPAPPELLDDKKKKRRNRIKLPGDVEKKVGVALTHVMYEVTIALVSFQSTYMYM